MSSLWPGIQVGYPRKVVSCNSNHQARHPSLQATTYKYSSYPVMAALMVRQSHW